MPCTAARYCFSSARRSCFGSWWGVARLFAVLFAFRIEIEQRALIAGLPGYADCKAHMRYRLAPGLW